MRVSRSSARCCIALAGALAGSAALAGTLTPARPSDVVTLTSGPGEPCQVTGTALGFRVRPDGALEPFAVPPGRVLVVTGIDFTTASSEPTDVELFAEKVPNSSQIFVTAVSTGGGSAAIPNAVVAAGASLCVRATLKAGGSSSVLAVAHGFLAKDK